MRAEHFNPFISATIEVFRTMLGCELTRGQLGLKNNSSPAFEVSGMIGISGGMHGMVVVSLSRETAISATEKMLGDRPDTLNSDVTDAVGEIANMIAGAAKTKFASSALSIGLPTVVCGKDHLVTFPSQSTPMTLPFESELGAISVEIGLADSAC